LIELIENEIELHGTAGLFSRGKKLLKKLRPHPQPFPKKEKGVRS